MSRDNWKVGGVTVVNEPARAELDERQLVDYRQYKHGLVEWLRNLGKDPC